MRRVLLDECVPRSLAGALNREGIDATPFPNDWKQLPDGALIDTATSAGFDVLITNDRNMPAQQPLKGQGIAVLIVPARRRHELLHLAALIVRGLDGLPRGEFTVLTGDGRFVRADETRPRRS